MKIHTECRICKIKMLENLDSWIWSEEHKGYICDECAQQEIIEAEYPTDVSGSSGQEM